MMRLPPIPFRISPKDATGANGEFHLVTVCAEFPSFASDHVEQVAGLVKGIVVKLEPVSAGAPEQRLIGLADFAPSALDSS